MKKLIVLADWEHDTLRRSLVLTAITSYLKEPKGAEITFVAAGSTSLQAAYILAQLVESEEVHGAPVDTVILVDILSQRLLKDQVQDEQLLQPYILKTRAGLYVCGQNRENLFALIKPKIDEAFIYKNFKIESVFPARDSYSRIVAHLMDSLEDDLDLEEKHTDTIAGLSGFFVGYVDTFGDVYTNITIEDLKGKVEVGALIRLTIGNQEIQATYVKQQYSPDDQSALIYPSYMGSQSNPYIALRSRPALHHLNPGTPINLHL